MSIQQGYENFLKVYSDGTHGSGDWHYYGNTLLFAYWLDYSSSQGGYYNRFILQFVDYEDEVYDELLPQVQAANTYAHDHTGWTYIDEWNYLYNFMSNLADAGVMKDWELYKFVFEDRTIESFTKKCGQPYCEYPAGTAVMCHTDYFHSPMVLQATTLSLNGISSEPTITISHTAFGWDGTPVPADRFKVLYNDYPIVWSQTSGAVLDYLTGHQDPGPEPPSDPEDYDNTPIRGSDEYNNLIENYLTNFTVLAEIDGTNLNLIAQALNNDINLEDSIPEMLAKIGRSIIQKNMAEGILSIKLIPIPKGESLPYKTGLTETLFKPLGLGSVQGKKLKNTIKKYTIGSMQIHKIYGDYRDFLCEYSIYLPFSGIHRLDADVIVGNSLQIAADIDFLTGTILYHLIVNDGYTARDIYTFTGDCAIELPITGADYSAKYQSIMSGIFSGVGMAAGAMMGGPMGAGAGAALTNVAMSGLKTLGNAASVKGNYMQSGKLVPNSAALSVLYPYLIISKPQDVSPNYASVKGRPCHKMLSLSSLSGFTTISNINLDSISYATDEDKEAIRTLLANGVYF